MWLKERHDYSIFFIQEYKFVRVDRKSESRGDIALFIRINKTTSIPFILLHFSLYLSRSSVDVIGVIFSLRSAIFSVYRPPHSAELSLLESHLDSVMINIDYIICVDDFNVNMLKFFANDTCSWNNIQLINIIYLLSLKQLIMSPTCVVCVSVASASLLDFSIIYDNIPVVNTGVCDSIDIVMLFCWFRYC